MEMSIRFPNIGINLSYVGRGISVFGYEITFYGILIALGMMLGICFIVLEAKRRGQEPNLYLGMILTSMIIGTIGGRLLYVAFSWTLYRGNIQSIFNIRNGGMSFYGALFGGILGALLFGRIKKTSFWKVADTASMGLLISQIIGRWGDFFNRESFGEYTGSYFAMQLPLSSVQSGSVSALMRENLTVVDGISYIQVHPVFLYESALCLILLFFLLASQRRKKFQGEIFMRYMSLYGLIRCFTEWLRTDGIRIPGTRISVSFVISAFLFLFFGTEALVRRAMEKKRAAARKRRKEALYAAEEQAEAELDRQDKEKEIAAKQKQEALAAKKEQEIQSEENQEDDWDGTLPSARKNREDAEDGEVSFAGKNREDAEDGEISSAGKNREDDRDGEVSSVRKKRNDNGDDNMPSDKNHQDMQRENAVSENADSAEDSEL